MIYDIAADETGGNWGSTVHGLCLCATTAFIAIDGIDLSTYAAAGNTHMLVLSDSTAKNAVGYIDLADEGLTLVATLVTNGDMSNASSWTAGTGWSVASGVATKTAGTASDLEQTITLTAGKLYKLVYTITRTAGTLTAKVGGSYWSARNSAATYTEYICTAASDQKVVFSADASYAGTVDNVSVQEVSHAAATGVHIVSAVGGSTRAWAAIESGFNRNDTSYRLAVCTLASPRWKGNHQVGIDIS